MNTNLWQATKHPDGKWENWHRAMRVLDFINEAQPPVMYKDIRRELGLSYWQTVRAVGLLIFLGEAHVTVISQWNGCNYVYPHHVWPINPRNL